MVQFSAWNYWKGSLEHNNALQRIAHYVAIPVNQTAKFPNGGGKKSLSAQLS